MSAAIADRIAKRKWRHAKLTKLRILDKPRDGREDLIL
jgi:hypothetical protein